MQGTSGSHIPTAPPLSPHPRENVHIQDPNSVKYCSPNANPCVPQPQFYNAPAPVPIQYVPQPVWTPQVMPQMVVAAAAPPPPPQRSPETQANPNINVVVNNTNNDSPIHGINCKDGNSVPNICPKCRKGLIQRSQYKKRKRFLICLSVCCFPLTCGIPLFCLICNYVDCCTYCKKNYGHRGLKKAKKTN